MLQGVLTIALLFPLCGATRRLALRQRWAARLLAVLGVELRAEGCAVAPGCMLVANHISWIDIFVINALAPSAFVSKAEVRAWPVAGWRAARSGTGFLRRGRRGHARLVTAESAALLDAGRNVAVFPEGTTTDGSHVLGFHAALLQPAIACGHAVQPLALSYHTTDGRRSLAPAYDGEVSFGQCLRAIVAERRLIARIHATPALATTEVDRRALATHAQATIAAVVAAAAQPATCHTVPSSMRSAVSLPPHTQPESSAISPSSR